jgi:hypothetical protein
MCGQDPLRNPFFASEMDPMKSGFAVSALALVLSAALAGAAGGQLTLHTMNGNTPTGTFAETVAGIGDFDQDGYDDFAVANDVEDNGPNGFQAGRVWVYSGRSGTVLADIQGSAGDRLGSDVAGAGDVNQDGFLDLVVGLDGADSNGVDSGSARIYSGAWYIAGTAPRILHTFTGDTAGGRFGHGVDAAGDVNQDGYDDVIVGEPWAVPSVLLGRIKVFSGANGSVLFSSDGINNGSNFGRSVAGLGDLNNDGYAEFCAGAWDDSTFGTSAGMVRVFDGASGSVLRTIFGSAAMERMGHDVARVGDADGDGTPDLLVSAYEGGFVRIYSGNWIVNQTGVAILQEWTAPPTSSVFGWDVDGAGDVDGDGHQDVVVGSYLNSPGSLVQNGSAFVYSGRSGDLLFQADGSAAHDHLGMGVAGAGDCDGDGRSDVIVGAPNEASNGSDTGLAWVLKQHDCFAGWSNYGAGHPGFLGVPSLTLSANPVIGATVDLQASNSFGFGALQGTVYLGLAPAQIPTSWGGDLLLIPFLVIPLSIPSAGLNLPLAIPNDEALCGFQAFFQVLMADFTAQPAGIAFTPGLQLDFGF